MNNFHFFKDLFSHITQKDLISVTTNINVENSKDITIKNNTIEHKIFVNGIPDVKQSLHKSKIDISFQDAMSSDKLERALLNIEYIDKFIAGCNSQNICPTFRYYALFSHLSTLRSETDYSDYNQMVLEEKKSFEIMLALNYKIKLIISLDIPIIITKWGYSLEETEARIANLCDNVDRMTKEHNIEIVIDEKNSMNGTYILDDLVLIRAVDVDPEKKYSMTKFETNPFVISNAIHEFDQKFEYCKLLNQGVRRMLHTDSYSALIRTIVQNNIEYYYKVMNEMKL